MTDRQDQTDDPIESELRSWFKSRRTPAVPLTLRAFADQVGSGARPTAPVRRPAFGWRQTAPRGRLAAAATTIAIVVLAGGLLVVSGQRGPAAPTASLVTSQRAQTASPSPSPVPSADGACSADQFGLGSATSAYGFGTLGTTSITVTQPLRNAGGNCVLDLPGTIRVASATGTFQAVSLVDAGAATSINVRSGQSLSVELRAWWSLAIAPSGGTPLPAPPCADPINDVSRVEIPLRSGSIEIDLDINWHEVCTSPASVSLTFVTEAAAPSSPAPSPDVTARYPDGIPSTFLGQRVYRPSDFLQTVPTGPFLLGGWDAGPLAVSCPAMVPGASNPPCPSFEALAETRGGPMVIAVRWGAFPVPGAPALVLRVTAEPAPTCVSIPPGGCPGPSVTVQDVLWAGDPSASTSPSPSPSSDDSATARSVASQYETARASGDWQTAWSMLSAYSQSVIGSLAKYEQLEKAYNASGGTTFKLQDPTQNPDFLAPAFLGQAYVDVQAKADISRAWLVFVEHPNVRGASAATIGLLIAPIDEHWYVWIAH
jgi:hypothetical protein